MGKGRAQSVWSIFGRSAPEFVFLSEMASHRAGLRRLGHCHRADGEIDGADPGRRLEDHVDARDIREVDTVVDELIERQFHAEGRRKRRNVAPTLSPSRSGEQLDVEIQALGQALESHTNEPIGIATVRTEVRVHGRACTVTHVHSSCDVEGGVVNEGGVPILDVRAELKGRNLLQRIGGDIEIRGPRSTDQVDGISRLGCAVETPASVLQDCGSPRGEVVNGEVLSESCTRGAGQEAQGQHRKSFHGRVSCTWFKGHPVGEIDANHVPTNHFCSAQLADCRVTHLPFAYYCGKQSVNPVNKNLHTGKFSKPWLLGNPLSCRGAAEPRNVSALDRGVSHYR